MISKEAQTLEHMGNISNIVARQFGLRQLSMHEMENLISTVTKKYLEAVKEVSKL